MYMGPITAARPPSSILARRIVGVPTLMVAILVMIPWLAIGGLVAGIVMAARASIGLPRLMVSAITYAGEIAIGR